MARSFVAASSQYLQINTPVLTAFPFAMAGWGNPTNVNNSYVLCSVCRSNYSNYQSWIAFAGGTAGDPIQAASHNYGSSPVIIVSTTSGFTANTWTHAAGLFSQSDKRAYINGGGKGVDTTAGPPASNHDRTAIGALRDFTPDGYFDGMIAEVGYWDLSVWPGATDSDKLDEFEKIVPALAAGYSPLFFPLGLVAYYPLIGRTSPEIDVIGGYAMTVSGATVAEHSQMLYPGLASLGIPVTAPAGATIPLFAYNYRRQRINR